MIDLGYDTHNPIITLRTLMVLQVFYVFRLLILFGVLYPLKTFLVGRSRVYFKKMYKKLKATLIFSEILAILFGSLIELLIAGSLFQSTPDDNPNRNALNYIISIYFIVTPVIVIPGLFFWMFTKNLNRIKSNTFQKRWGVLTDELSMQRPTEITFYLMYCLRRVFFVGLSVVFVNTPVFQVIGINLLNLVMLIYIAQIQPFKGRFRNRIELFNDFGQINISFFLALFTPFMTNPEVQDDYGWLVVGLVSLFMMINMVIVVYFIFY